VAQIIHEYIICIVEGYIIHILYTEYKTASFSYWFCMYILCVYIHFVIYNFKWMLFFILNNRPRMYNNEQCWEDLHIMSHKLYMQAEGDRLIKARVVKNAFGKDVVDWLQRSTTGMVCVILTDYTPRRTYGRKSWRSEEGFEKGLEKGLKNATVFCWCCKYRLYHRPYQHRI